MHASILMHSAINRTCSAGWIFNTYISSTIYHTYNIQLEFTVKGGQLDLPQWVASSTHVSHLALQSPVPAVAHQLCCWWAEQSQGLHQLSCHSCACTSQSSGGKGQSRGQCSNKVMAQGVCEQLRMQKLADTPMFSTYCISEMCVVWPYNHETCQTAR